MKRLSRQRKNCHVAGCCRADIKIPGKKTMPSKNDLELFRDELRSLADEKNIRAEKNEPFEDIPLPEDQEARDSRGVPEDIASLLGLKDDSGSVQPDTGKTAEVNADINNADDELQDFSGLGGLDDVSSMSQQEDQVSSDDSSDFDLDNFAKLLDNLPLEPDTADAGPASVSGDSPSENAEGPIPAEQEDSPGAGNDTGVDDGFSGVNADDFSGTDEGSSIENPGSSDSLQSGVDLASGIENSSDPVSGTNDDSDDFGIPEDLLSGFGDEMERTASQVSPEEVAPGDIVEDGQGHVIEEEPDFSVPEFGDDDLMSGGSDAEDVPEVSPGKNSDFESFDIPDFDDSFDAFSSNEDSGKTEGGASSPDVSGSTESSVLKTEDGIPDNSGTGENPDAGQVLSDTVNDIKDETGGSLGAVNEDLDSPSVFASEEDASSPGSGSQDDGAGDDGSGFESLDFDDIMDTGSLQEPTESPGDISSSASLPDLDSMDLGSDFSADDFEIPDFPAGDENSDAGNFSGGTSGAGPAPSEEVNLSVPEEPLDDFKDFNPPEGDSPGDTSFSIDSPDSFSLENDGIQDNFNLQGFSDGQESFGEDFSFGGIPGLSDIPGHPAQNLVYGSKNSVKFSISEKDFEKFINNLNLYPLNLRVAIEDLILNAVVPEAQIQEVVNLVVNHAPAKQVANTTGKILDRSIDVPKFFEKRSGFDREDEKSSLGYVFRYKILPVACLSLIGIILLGCVFFLGREFLYNPLKARSLYTKGYECLEDNRFTLSQNYFNEGARYRESKNWYYKYARGYREKKQYQLASSMYERMIYRYPKDKNPPLEYAFMECYELLNYEKAEEIVKRKVLDVFVNDKDGKLLLGDIYMEWGGLDPSKYDLAGSVYQELIDTEGRKDLYLGRLLRYNIRTDQLAEVLPLKDYFMQKKAVLDSETLVELSGYMLEKRYAPPGGDDDYLRPMITDVRSLLEKSVAQAGDVPESHYNYGKYFIYNGNYSSAIPSLKEAVRLFDEAQKMNPGRIIRNIDACRLLGESYAAGAEYIPAGEIYAKGITMYQDSLESRTINPDITGGLLYADIGDMDYFLSGNYNQALESYTNAVENLNDTDSVRYKMGCINYSFENYEEALNNFSRAYGENPDDKNLMYAMGNAFFLRGDYGAAQGYYTRLMEKLETLRVQYGIVIPQVRVDHSEFVKMYMETANNLGVTLYYLAGIGGDSEKNIRGIASLTESLRAYDALTRNPDTMIRLSGSNLAEMNLKYMNFPDSGYKPGIYGDIALTLEGEEPLSAPE